MAPVFFAMRRPYRFIPALSPAYRAARRFASRFWYAGHRVQCQLCLRPFRKWLHNPEHGTCPYCRSGARHRLMWHWLAGEWGKDSKPRSLLHFAPEWCLQRRFRNDPRVSRYVTCDLSAPEVDVYIDITAMNFENGAFDTIICSHVLEHVGADRTAMKELFRVLVTGGVAIIQVPYSSDRAETDEDPGVTIRPNANGDSGNSTTSASTAATWPIVCAPRASSLRKFVPSAR